MGIGIREGEKEGTKSKVGGKGGTCRKREPYCRRNRAT